MHSYNFKIKNDYFPLELEYNATKVRSEKDKPKPLPQECKAIWPKPWLLCRLQRLLTLLMPATKQGHVYTNKLGKINNFILF